MLGYYASQFLFNEPQTFGVKGLGCFLRRLRVLWGIDGAEDEPARRGFCRVPSRMIIRVLGFRVSVVLVSAFIRGLQCKSSIL